MVNSRKNLWMKILQYIANVFAFCSILYFLFGELLIPGENLNETSNCTTFNQGWEQVYADGSRHPITVPGQCDVEQAETLVVERKLPRNLEDTWMCIRSSQQDLMIYVGEELRTEYSTKDTRNFGKNSVSLYVFFEIQEGDAGKTLRIESTSDSPYSGYINDIYMGDRSDIWKQFLGMYLPGTLVSLFMLLLSLAVICYTGTLYFTYHKRMDIIYLAGGLLLASVWLMSESRLRQLLLPNSTIASNVGFLMVMVLPYPFVSYANKIQQRRYQPVYMIISALMVMNCFASTLLQIFNIKDFSETMRVSHAVIIAYIVVMVITVLIDFKRGFVKEYWEVAIGFFALMLSGLYEIYLVYQKASLYNGISLCIGLVVLLLTACVKTGHDMLQGEKEKQMAIIANESKALFLANMSHEIRTPINTVIGMNEMILRENKESNIKEYATNIQQASSMLLGLINNILDFSKIEAGKLEIVEGKYQLASVLNDIISTVKLRIRNKNITVELDVDKQLPSVLKGDEIRIKQILNNLASNAVKYTDKGVITLSAKGEWKEEAFYLQLSVRDTGNGIKPEDMERLFDSFQRLELKKNRYIEGTGLGLSITKQLVDQMKGFIHVESEYGKGSCFTVRIPQVIVDEKPMGDLGKAYQKSEQKKEETEKTLYAPNASVLVVDDNKMNLTVVKALLKRSAMQLDLAMGGQECLELTRKKSYDLILMDHMMPEPDGIETLHLLRAEKGNPNQKTKVIVLTANAVAGAEEQYKAEGFADYLSKPVSGAKLEEMLARHLETKA